LKLQCLSKGDKLIKVVIGEDPLEEEFFKEKKKYEKNNPQLLSKLEKAIEGEDVDFTEHIDWKLLNLTDFQRKVLYETFLIPFGEVKTYKEIGELIGTKAYRAVGNALNKNPIAIAIPCHRVIGTNKKLTGFRVGIDVKKQMLVNEGHKIKKEKLLE